jgi:hypothetical protein
LNIGGRSLIQPGQRIEIPAGTGNWYTIGWIEDLNDNGTLQANEDDQSSMTPMPPLDNNNGELDFLINVFGVDWMSIRGHYSPSVWDAAAGTYTAQPSTGVPYRLELAPTILANSEPAQLDRGIVIDLHASQIPAAWRAGAPMDIMFDASGNPTGDFVAAGLIHLYLAAVSDVELTRARFVDHPVNGGSRSLPIVPAAFTATGAEPIVPLVEPRVVTLYTQTGQVARSRIDFTDNFNNEPPFGAGMDFEADTPYSFAQRGREAK